MRRNGPDKPAEREDGMDRAFAALARMLEAAAERLHAGETVEKHDDNDETIGGAR
jgi:hypothetical protein